jgi:hypothetical protein
MADKRPLLWRLLLNNKRLKALSLLLATLTWYLIQDTISFEIEIPGVRLEIQVQDGMAILNQSASTVDVIFRGSQDDIQRLDARRIQALVELTGPSGELSHEIVMKPGMIKGIRGVRAIAIHPERILVKLDRQAEKRVPVKGRTLGSPLFGQVEAVTCEPSTVLGWARGIIYPPDGCAGPGRQLGGAYGADGCSGEGLHFRQKRRPVMEEYPGQCGGGVGQFPGGGSGPPERRCDRHGAHRHVDCW